MPRPTLLLLALLATCRFASAEPIDFEKSVRPLLVERCSGCHGAEQQKGGLRLDARQFALRGGDSGEVIVAGDVDSELLRRVRSTDEAERMPPEGAPLDAGAIALLEQWIADGAEWPETEYDRAATHDPRRAHWAFQPLEEITPPPLPPTWVGQETPVTAIDQFVIAKLAEHQLTFAPQADRPTLIRRLSLDVLGLPPRPEQVASFAADNDSDAYHKLVDALLASPHYGERWAQHWLDVVRYADTHGFEVNTPRDHAWPYRDYVIRSLNEDKPYNQFVFEQIAGDTCGADEATGFLVASAVLLPGQIGADDVSKRAARQDALDEIIVGTGSTLLGLTIGCARCHDHKFDPVTQRDYYAFQAFFAGVEYGDRPIHDLQYRSNLARADELKPRLAELEHALRKFEPRAFIGRTLIIDEADAARTDTLQTPNGPGMLQAGTARGQKDDPGSADQAPNLSRGAYTWWNNVPGQDVIAFKPGVNGHFRLWISWGVHGSGVHTRDARFLLDRDGDLSTRGDQTELARVDQYYPAGVQDGTTPQTPLWSGLQDAGIVALSDSAKIVVRGGDTGTGITADVLVLQEVDLLRLSPSEGKLPHLRAPVTPTLNVESFTPVMARFVRFVTHETVDNNLHEPCLDELEIFASADALRNVALASAGARATSSGNYSDSGSHQLKHINDGAFGNEHSWISNERGGGWVQIELPEPMEINRVVWSRDRNGKYQDRLAVRYQLLVSVDGETWQQVAGGSDRAPLATPHDPVQTLLRNNATSTSAELLKVAAELEQLRTETARLETPRLVFGGTFREPDDTYLLRRGNAEQRIDEVGPDVPQLFGSLALDGNAPENQRRQQLARWIASPNNPLTARVIVNRIWHYHFGRGLVDSPNDFGLNGAQPSHPELLDWLAGELIRGNWSIKQIHRLILSSATYRQMSRLEPRGLQVDPDNRLLWHFPARRLEAEAIRDCMLAVSGELNLKTGGPGFNFFQARGGLNGFPPLEQFGAEELRRMVYAHKVRMERVPVFGVFDCPDAGQSVPARIRSTTALQALNLFNSPFVMERSKQLARRVQQLAGDDVEAQVRIAFQLALSRLPSETEMAAIKPVIRDHGLATLGRVLFNSSEFLFMP